MRAKLHARLIALARRHGAGEEAEDMVQEALLAGLEAGRHDLGDPGTGRWLAGVVRNKARMTARTARRRRGRETRWQAERAPPEPVSPPAKGEILEGLPKALRQLAALVLTGHTRREIAYLLGLSDAALRQRVSALKRHLGRRGLAAPVELTGLGLDIAYGRIREALLPALLRHGGVFASHDPDGHLFVVRRSQSDGSRPQDKAYNKESAP